MEPLLVIGGAALVVIPLSIWLHRRSDAVMDVITRPQRHSRRGVIGVNVGVAVVMALALSALPFISRGDIEDEGSTRYRWLAAAFPKTSLFDQTNWLVVGICIGLMWVAMALFARRAIRIALRKRESTAEPDATDGD